MLVSSTNLLILVIALAALSLGAGWIVTRMAARRDTGRLPGNREPGGIFLAGSSAPRASVLGAWYLPLAAVDLPETSSRRSRRDTRSPFSQSFGKSPFFLPSLNDGQHARRFWSAIGAKAKT